MSRNRIGLEFTTNLGNLNTSFRKLNSQIGRNTGDFRKFQKETRKLNDSFVNMNRDVNRSTKTFKGLGGGLLSLNNIIKGIGIWKLSGMLKGAMKSAMDMIETTHLFEVSLRELSVETDNYIRNMSDITGLDVGNLRNRIGSFNLLAKTMGMTAKNAQTLGINVNSLALDMGALFNVSYQQVSEDLRSGLIGQSRTMYKYGIDVTEASIAQEALNRGITKSVRHMTQGEKMALRYSVMIKQMSTLQGDFANTIDTPMNQLRVLNERFVTLSRTIGSLFIPVLERILPILNAVVTLLNRLFSMIGGFLGIEAILPVKNMKDDFNSFGKDAEDALDGIGKKAKKLNKQLMGFDEIHSLNPKEDSGGSGGLDNIGSAFDFDLDSYDALFDGIRQKSDEIADNISNWFKEHTMPFTNSLKELWEEGLKPMMKFTGDNLSSFFHDFIKPVGEWSLGEEGIPRLVIALKNLLSEIDWDTLLESFTRFHEALARFTIGIGGGLVLFYEDLLEFLTPVVVELVEGFGGSLDKLSDTLNNIPEDKLERIGYVIGIISASLMAWNLLKGVFSVVLKLLSPLITKFGTLVGGISKLAGALELPLLPTALLVGGLALITFTIIDLWNTNEEFRDDLVTIWNFLGDTLSSIWETIIKPVFDIFKETILDIYEEGVKPFVEKAVEAISKFVELISPEMEFIFEELIPKVIDIFKLLMDTVGIIVIGSLNFLGEFLVGIMDVVEDISNVFGGLITFLTGVFTGDWKKAWEGLVQIFKSIINGINNIFGTVINSIISGINAMIRGLNKIQIPDWVPLMGGKGININEISSFNVPQLAQGGQVSMGQMFVAREAGAELVGNFGGRTGVMNNKQIVDSVSEGVYKAVVSALGMNQSSSSGNNDREIVVQLDGREMGRVLLPNLDSESQRLGYESILRTV